MPRQGNAGDFGFNFDPTIQSVRELRSEVSELREEALRTQEQTRRTSQALNETTNTLGDNLTKLLNEVKGISSALANLNSTTGEARNHTSRLAATMDDAFDVYKKMGLAIEKMGIDLKGLQFTEAELNKVVKLGNDYNDKRSNSYDALSQRYRAMKILYDNMTESERKQNQAFVAGLRDLYQQMNLLQQATGKYQLQVGNYSKAFTGLNIATQQVVRELPTLANSATTFAIAISNNIPILVDNILAVKQSNAASIQYRNTLLKEAEAAKIAGDTLTYATKKAEAHGIKTTSAFLAVAKSIFSWQSAIVLLLTVLPSLIRKIEEKKKAQDEDNISTKEQIEYLKLLKDAMMASSKAIVEDGTKTRTLINITKDYNRSNDDRIKAAQVLKNLYSEQLDNYSAEEIALGKAKTALDQITQSIVEQAKARAILNKITEAYVGQLDAEDVLTTTRGERTGLGVAPTIGALSRYIKQLQKTYTSKAVKDFLKTLPEETRASLEKYNKAFEDFNEYQKTIDELEKRLPLNGLFNTLVEGRKPRSSREVTKSILNKDLQYLEKALETQYENIENEEEREVALSNLKFDQQIQQYEKYLTDQMALQESEREITENGVTYITNIITELLVRRGNEEEKIRNKYREKDKKEREKSKKEKEKEENDNFKEALRQLKLKLDSEDNLAIDEYENSILRNRRLLKNEEEYWKAYRELLKKYGRLTEGDLKDINANIDRARTERGRERATNIWELIGVWTNKEIDKDAQRALNEAFSTSFEYMNEWMDKRLEMAEVAVEAAQKEVEATKEALDLEQQARVNGYANNVELTRREYEKRLEAQRQAVEQEKRIQKQQEMINIAQQASSLVTATANIIASYSSLPLVGQAAAVASIAAMWTLFGVSKAKANQLIKAKQYGNGMSEYIDYGGSHASGNDIDFGTMRDGTHRRIERGEMVGVINKRNVSKYGVGTVSNIIDSLNKGTFEEKYGMAFAGGANIVATDLSNVEGGINTLVKQGERKTIVTPNGVIEYYKGNKRVIRN